MYEVAAPDAITIKLAIVTTHTVEGEVINKRWKAIAGFAGVLRVGYDESSAIAAVEAAMEKLDPKLVDRDAKITA